MLTYPRTSSKCLPEDYREVVAETLAAFAENRRRDEGFADLAAAAARLRENGLENDARIFDTLCAGGTGAIAASAHVRTERFVALHRAVAEQRLDDARRIAQELAPLIRALFAEPNPAPLKALLAHEGLISDELRPPQVAASAPLRQQLAML